MPVALILSLVEQVPNLFAAAMAMRADLSQTDQVKLDAALDAARAAAMTDAAQLAADAQART